MRVKSTHGEIAVRGELHLKLDAQAVAVNAGEYALLKQRGEHAERRKILLIY